MVIFCFTKSSGARCGLLEVGVSPWEHFVRQTRDRRTSYFGGVAESYRFYLGHIEGFEARLTLTHFIRRCIWFLHVFVMKARRKMTLHPRYSFPFDRMTSFCDIRVEKSERHCEKSVCYSISKNTLASGIQKHVIAYV